MRYTWILLAAAVVMRTASGAGLEAQPPSYALLVGCSKYYNNPSKSLEGPANDVVLMRELLERRFGFKAHDIVTLAEMSEEGYKPTRVNIAREIGALVGKVKAHRDSRVKPRVVIYLSGHGTFQPDSEASAAGKEELDGRDEVFLPADIGQWNAGKQTVENAIVDDELGAWARAIAEQGAHLWVIVDACHSGSALRSGNVAEVARYVPPAALGIPSDSLGTLDEAGAQQSGWHEPSAGGYVAFYAAQPDEKAVERIPYGSRHRKKYGLFTHTLARVLIEANEPLTYHELLQRVQSKYRTWGRERPHPVVAGALRDHFVLEDDHRRPFWLLMKVGGRWRVDAGNLQGVSRGSILAVYPQAGIAGSGRLLGYVEVTEATFLAADVAPIRFKGMPAPDDGQLVDGCRCELARVEWGDLRVAIGVDDTSARGAGESRPDRREKLLRQAAGRIREWANNGEMPFRLVEDWTAAEWVVRWRSGQLWLSHGTALSTGEGKEPLWRPVLIGADDLDDSLREALAKVARAQNLIRLASSPVWSRGDGSRAVDVELRLFGTDEESRLARGAEVRDGMSVIWQIANRSMVPVHVALFYIDSRYGITQLTNITDVVRANGSSGRYRLTFKVRHGGLEHFLLVATEKVRNTPAPDLSGLTRPAIELLSVKRGERTGVESPLERVLHTASSRTKTRSSRLTAPENCVLRVFPVVAVPPSAGNAAR